MPSTWKNDASEDPPPPDLLIGELAIAHHMVTAAQVRACLARQRSLPDGQRPPLGQLLVEGDFLTLGQLNYLVQTQQSQLARQEELVQHHPEEALFGKLAVHRGLVSAEQLSSAIREKANLDRLKIHFRLGEVLVKKGLLTAHQVQEVLEIQRKKILCCRDCNSRFNIAQFAPDQTFHCPLCGAALVPPAPDDQSLAVKESLRRPSTARVAARPGDEQ